MADEKDIKIRSEVESVKLDVALLKRDVAQISELFGKIDLTIEKLHGISETMTKMFAVHEERILKQEETDRKFYLELENLRKDTTKEVRTIVDRMAEMDTDLATHSQRLNDHLDRNQKKDDGGLIPSGMMKYVVLGAVGMVGFIVIELPTIIKFVKSVVPFLGG